jgi:hypothetical protein
VAEAASRRKPLSIIEEMEILRMSALEGFSHGSDQISFVFLVGMECAWFTSNHFNVSVAHAFTIARITESVLSSKSFAGCSSTSAAVDRGYGRANSEAVMNGIATEKSRGFVLTPAREYRSLGHVRSSLEGFSIRAPAASRELFALSL